MVKINADLVLYTSKLNLSQSLKSVNYTVIEESLTVIVRDSQIIGMLY